MMSTDEERTALLPHWELLGAGFALTPPAALCWASAAPGGCVVQSLLGREERGLLALHLDLISKRCLSLIHLSPQFPSIRGVFGDLLGGFCTLSLCALRCCCGSRRLPSVPSLEQPASPSAAPRPQPDRCWGFTHLQLTQPLGAGISLREERSRSKGMSGQRQASSSKKFPELCWAV